MWMDPREFTVTVDQGIVTVRGEVERSSTIPILVGIIRSVPGVIDVIERVSSRLDDDRETTAPPPYIVA